MGSTVSLNSNANLNRTMLGGPMLLSRQFSSRQGSKINWVHHRSNCFGNWIKLLKGSFWTMLILLIFCYLSVTRPEVKLQGSILTLSLVSTYFNL